MNKKGQAFYWILVFIAIFTFICVIGYHLTYAFSNDTQVITVKTKWTKIIDGTENYRITTSNGEIFTIQDSLVNGKMESASTYVNLEEGKTYLVQYQGFRNGFFSFFKNILVADEVLLK